MLTFYEKLASQLNKLNPWLTIIAAILFVGVFVINYLVVPKELKFVLAVITVWACCIAIFIKMFLPVKGKDEVLISKVRSSSRMFQIYVIASICIWFILLFAGTSILIIAALTGSLVFTH